MCESAQARGRWARGPDSPSSSARRGKENSMRTLFLYCFPRNRTARFCPVCIPVALPPGALPLKEGLPSPAVSLAGFLRPLRRGMPAWQEDTLGQGLSEPPLSGRGSHFSPRLPPEGPDRRGTIHSPELHGPWWCSAEVSLKPASSEHRSGALGGGVFGWFPSLH